MRFEAGTPPIVETVGLAAAIDYVEGLGREAIARHEHDLIVYATERLLTVEGLRILGTAPGKGADPVLHRRRHPPARPRHHRRPVRGGGARRAALRRAADGAVRGGRHGARLLRPLQHPGGG